MKKFSLILVLLFSLVSEASDFNYIRSLHSFNKKGEFFVKVIFSKDLDKKNISIDYINRTVQFDIDNSKFKKVKKSYKTSFETVNNIYVYQIDKSQTRVRVNFKSPVRASRYKNNIDLSVSGNEMFITFSDLNKKKKAAAAITTDVLKKPEPKSDVKKDAQKRDVAAAPAKKQVYFEQTHNLESLLQDPKFLFLICLLFLFMYFKRPRRIFLKKGNFKVLDECKLDKDKYLSLVEHGDKRFIIAFNKNEIQLLKEDVAESSLSETSSFMEEKTSFPVQKKEILKNDLNTSPELKIKSFEDFKRNEFEDKRKDIIFKITNSN